MGQFPFARTTTVYLTTIVCTVCVTDVPIFGQKGQSQSHVGPLNFRIGDALLLRKSLQRRCLTAISFNSVTVGFSHRNNTTKLMLGFSKVYGREFVFATFGTLRYANKKGSFTGRAVYRGSHSAADLFLNIFSSWLIVKLSAISFLDLQSLSVLCLGPRSTRSCGGAAEIARDRKRV